MAFPRLVVSYGQVRALRVVVVAVVICVTLVTTLRLHSRAHQNDRPSIYDYTEGRTSPWRDWRNKNNGTHASSPEGKFLKQLIQRHDLTNEVTWSARVVQAKYAGRGQRPSVTEVKDRFLERDFVSARVQDADLRLALEEEDKLKLPVAGAKGKAVDASKLLFGVSTTYSRLAYANHELIRDWESWLTDGNGKSNGAHLLLTLHKSTLQDEMDEVTETLQSYGIDATVLLSKGGDDSASRYIDLLQELKSHSTTLAGKTFVGLVDDDVFFPSMGRLVQKLSKFNADKEYYIGAPSERSDWAIDNNKTVTYGGGAVFLSLPMIDQLAQSKCLTKSKRTADDEEAPQTHSQDFHIGAQWDLQLYECITKHTSVDLHVLPSFFNPEDGELYSEDGTPIDEGYASGAQPLTLHQYRNVHRFDAGKGYLVARACGEDCFLQRFRFKDDWVLVNGYTLSHYPDGVDAVPLKKKKKGTKKPSPEDDDEENQKVVVGKRLVVDKDDQSGNDAKAIAWAGRKRTWRLLDARVGDAGEIWQAYVKRKDGGNSFEDARAPGDRVHAEEERTDKDSIVVLIWQP